MLAKVGIDERKSYCESLLELASSEDHFVGNPVAFGESDVKVRMKNLLNYKKPSFWVSVTVVVVIIAIAISCLSSPRGNKIYETSVTAEMTGITYPLTKEVVKPIFDQVDLPGMVMKEEYNSAIRTTVDIRDEENRLIAGIASTGEGDVRWLGITLIPYLHSGAASNCLPEEKWEEMINFATLLYGFNDKNMVYHDFIESYESFAIHTEYEREEELYYKHGYEWIKSYGNVTCVIEVGVATDGTKDIQTMSFYNSPEYSATNSEMAAKNHMYSVFTTIPGKQKETVVDEYAKQAGVQIRFVNAILTEVVNGDKDVADYVYTATLTKVKDNAAKEFTVTGTICVVNALNGWRVDRFQIDDIETLEKIILDDTNYKLTTEQVASQSTESHEDMTDESMLEIFQIEYGWTDLANQQLFWDEANGRVVINYYFEAFADEWQMDSAREYGLTTFVFKRQNSLGGPHTYQNWAYPQEIKEVVIQVFCNGIMNFQDIYGGIEDRIVHSESHYEK